MNNAIFQYKSPGNEPVELYKAGTPQRKALLEEIDRLKSNPLEIPLVIGGKEVYTGNIEEVRIPHDHQQIVARYHKAGEKEVQMAIDAALQAHHLWESLSWVERASITLKIAELISQKYKHLINAATMLGQSKTAHQAEIDAVDETVDFIRYNVEFASKIYNEQPLSPPGIINRLEYRPLEGFVFSVTPFNFTSIGSNLTLAPVLMGNTVVWKPSANAVLSNYLLMKIFEEGGVPPGVINFIPGDSSVIAPLVLGHKMLAGVHFTGSTKTFNSIYKTIGQTIDNYKSYPRIVGETGGKDFILAHSTANVDEVATAIVRGAFEYQGQKCSAASRAYVPQSMWGKLNEHIGRMLAEIRVGDVSQFENFMGAVISEKAYKTITQYIEKARGSDLAEILYGGTSDQSKGYFISPTIILTTDPHFVTMEEEIFGPVMTIYLYEDEKFDETLELIDNTSPYGLTGSVFSRDRYELQKACRALKYAAGNFYFNDKPTGAVVGQQPFGGSRASGTNDKAGSLLNLLRWVTPRTIKETLVPPTDFRYPFMKEGSCQKTKDS
jgi:1-pyrroline-5-carboxylate dehydrogenase